MFCGVSIFTVYYGSRVDRSPASASPSQKKMEQLIFREMHYWITVIHWIFV
ncbi:hypothetical protein ACSBR2_032045 [Camellia fascicularis]